MGWCGLVWVGAGGVECCIIGMVVSLFSLFSFLFFSLLFSFYTVFSTAYSQVDKRVSSNHDHQAAQDKIVQTIQTEVAQTLENEGTAVRCHLYCSTGCFYLLKGSI